MSDFDEKIIERLKRLGREVERLQVKEQPDKTGWIPVSGTWTYETATTITVPSGAASIYKVGMGIRLTQTTVKYFYIVGVADTVLTVTGGADYTLANATISAVSYTNTPDTAIGFPRVFQYTTTITGYTTNPKTATLEFKMIGNCVYVGSTYNRIDGNDSNTTTLTFTLPVPAYGSQLVTALGYSIDGSSVSTAPTGYIDVSGTIASCYKQYYQAAWTASGRKALHLQPFTYLA